MNEHKLNVVISLIVTLIGVLLSFIAPRQITIIDSVILGLFSYVVSSLVQLGVRTEPLEKLEYLLKSSENVESYLRIEDKLRGRGSRSSDHVLAFSLFKTTLGDYQSTGESSFAVAKLDIPALWLHSITMCESTWFCTNYVNLEDDWKGGWMRRGLYIQKAQAEEFAVNIRRIFIFDSMEEITDHQIRVMKMHADFGIKVRWVTKDSTQLYWAPFAEFEQRIGTPDLALVDGTYLLAFLLDDNRRHVSVVCHYSDEILRNIQSLYGRLWEESSQLSDLGEFSNRALTLNSSRPHAAEA